MTKQFVVLYEQGPTSWGAYSPDVPGVAAVGQTKAEVARRYAEALRLHLALLVEDGDPLPEPTHTAETITVSLPEAPVVLSA